MFHAISINCCIMLNPLRLIQAGCASVGNKGGVTPTFPSTDAPHHGELLTPLKATPHPGQAQRLGLRGFGEFGNSNHF